jgi:hypothetical protein
MKATELRIGNWVYNKYGVVRYVYGMWKDGVELSDDETGINDLDYNEDEVFGIPITEDWLINMGFETSKTMDKFFVKDNSIGISVADDKFRFIQGNFVCQLIIREIEFVHELQNLYFAIKGIELF